MKSKLETIGWILLILLMFGICGTLSAQRMPEKHIEMRDSKPKYSIRTGVYYSRSINQWNGNKWNGNVISMVVYDNKKWTPNVGYWYDPITKARGVTFGIKLIDFKIKK